MDETLKEFIKSSPAVVQKGRYAYVKVQEAFKGEHFMISKDDDEITIVIEEKNLSNAKYEGIEKWFKLIEFKTAIPFKGVGFLAAITNAIASKGRNVLVVSTFSKDYILIHEEDIEIAGIALKEIGFAVSKEGA